MTSPRDKGQQGRCGCTPRFSGPGLRKIAPITGTWDFKWPLGQTIKVWFSYGQEDKEMTTLAALACRKIKALAENWNGIANIKLDVRLPSDAPATEHSDTYDVLISLDPLPITFDATADDPAITITMPEAQFGTYNRRVDAGRPTAFLGRPAGMLSAKGGTLSMEEYFNSAFFEQAVVHELGHVLGLIHPQQVKGFVEAAGLKWRDSGEIEAILAQAFGPDAGTQEALDGIVTIVEGSARYSDYPLEGPQKDVPAHRATPGWASFVEQLGALDARSVIATSVMAPPLIGCLLAGARCTADACWCETVNSAKPSEFDKQLLRAMYPTNKQDGRVESVTRAT